MNSSGFFAPVVPVILRAKVAVFVELYKAQLELRRYRTQLEPLGEAEGARRHYRLYGGGPLQLDGEPGTDIAAVAAGYISLTPLRFDLFAEDALAPLTALLPESA